MSSRTLRGEKRFGEWLVGVVVGEEEGEIAEGIQGLLTNVEHILQAIHI